VIIIDEGAEEAVLIVEAVSKLAEAGEFPPLFSFGWASPSSSPSLFI
jgi:hypothetical protein